MTYRLCPDPDESRQHLVGVGVVPVLVGLLDFQDADVQYNCTAALSNITADGEEIIPSVVTTSLRGACPVLGVNRNELARGQPKLVQELVRLTDSLSLGVRCQAALALRNLAVDGKLQFPPPGISCSSPLQKTIS